jgi:hypothetical protein
MPTLDNLPADQRAVLQLVLQRGRGYDEIARLLSMDRAAVRERALNAFDALGPQTGVGDQRRALITDYLLGQLPPAVTRDVRDHLAVTPSERAWARVLAAELAPLSSRPLPEIPTEVSRSPEPPASGPTVAVPEATPPGKKQRESILLRRRRNKQAAAATPPAAQTPPAASAPAPPAAPAPPPAKEAPATVPPAEGKKQRESILLRRRRNKQAAKDEGGGSSGQGGTGGRGSQSRVEPVKPVTVPEVTGDEGERRSSRLGGAILLAVGVLAVIAVVAIIASSGGSNKPHSAAVASKSTTSPGASATTTASTSSGARVVAQVNLKPTAKNSKAAGIAEVLKEGTNDGIAIVAQNVPPNSTKPPNAYAVWLFNSTNDAHFLGFVNPGVGTNGKLSTAGGLPTNAAHYKQLIVTVETVSHPKAPGTIILAGPLSGL